MRIFVLTANYELRVSRKSHLRDRPNSDHLAEKVPNYKINLQNYVFLYFLAGWAKKVSGKGFPVSAAIQGKSIQFARTLW
jgi:hypothetical protein